MNIGDFVRYVGPADPDHPFALRELVAMVTEVDPNDENMVGLFIYWPTFECVPWRGLDNPVALDAVAPYAPDSWHPWHPVP